MLLDTPQSEALNGLSSGGRIDLMDTIDSLRSQGINHLVSLPQIIVCGDQSSGKSSVLEAISGVPFPVKSNLCTRFPTELVLRRSPQVSVTVSIIPDRSRSDSERASLAGFHEELEDLEKFPRLVEGAKSAMGISTDGRAFSKDLLRIEISGPDRPHLTIVDLPGLIHSQTRYQTASDVELIREVVQSYMEEPRSIILAVVSAKNDFANQIVLKMARSVDTGGARTLGVITKPDTLHPGSESESTYANLAQNKEIPFHLGWHVLRNMDSDTGTGMLSQRNAMEKEFFCDGIWKELPSTILGIEQLRGRLSKVLLSHIVSELPSLVAEIDDKRMACNDGLRKLGQPRVTPSEQQMYLMGVSESFQMLVKSAVDANCNDLFFKDVMSEYGYQQRIRAVVQNLNTQFADDLLKHGRRHFITDNTDGSPIGMDHISRSQFISHIETKMQRSRGKELHGLFDPMIIADLFRDEAGPWEKFARDHIRRVWNACKTFLRHVVAHVADTATCNALLQKIINPEMDRILAVLETKTGEILASHKAIHPITYDQKFAEAAQKTRGDQKAAEFSEILQRFFGVSSTTRQSVSRTVDFPELVKAMVGISEPDLNHWAASEALGYMEAYYKVAMNRFVDDIAVEAVEVCLISVLAKVLSPVGVYKMAPDLVAFIAGESQESRAQRDRLGRQLQVLSKGAETCQAFVCTHFEVFPNEKIACNSDDGNKDVCSYSSSDTFDIPQAADVVTEPDCDGWGFSDVRKKKRRS